MNYRNILKVYKLERELSDDETALLNTLREMTDAERELFAETLQPEKAMKAPTKERKIEKCVACNWTKRAAVHKDPNADGYHEFQSGGTVGALLKSTEKKSARASSLKEKIQGTAKGVINSNDDLPVRAGRCSDCGATADDNIHHLTSNENYHPFQPSTTAPPATRPSAANGGEGNSTANSETETETASSAGAGD